MRSPWVLDVSFDRRGGIRPSTGSASSPGHHISGPDGASTVTRLKSEYADVADMFLELKALEDGSAAHNRQREAIFQRTLPIARHVSQRFRNRGEPENDLYQVACVGLVNAVNRFDPDRGGEFLSFAVPTIMGEVRRHFRDFGWSVKVPRRMKDMQVQLVKAREELTRCNGRAPTASELAAHLGVDRESVLDAIVAATSYSTVSTDVTPKRGDESRSIADTLGDVDSRFQKVVDVESVRPLIAALSDRHRTVLYLRFFEDMTQSQIAQRLGYSQMHVSRLLGQALDSLRSQIAEPADAKTAVG